MACACTGTNIFSTRPGSVIAIAGEGTPTNLISINASYNTINNLKAIVTSVGIQGQGGYQFMHSMREFIYVYVFTERIGEIVLNGLTFPAECSPIGTQADDSCVSGTNGLTRVMTWYECQRITSRASIILIGIGTLTYEAFLVSMKAEIVNPDTGIAQFTMHFNFVPNISDSDDFCFPLDEDCTDAPCSPDT